MRCLGHPSLQQYKKIHAAIMGVYRLIIGYQKSLAYSDDDVINELQVKCPMTLLRARRLCLLATVSIDPVLTAIVPSLVDTRGSWAEAVMIDLQWLSIFPAFRDMYGWSLQMWFSFVANDPRDYKRAVMKVCNAPFANLFIYWALSPSMSTGGGSHHCSACNMYFTTYQRLQLHKYKKHGIKCAERRFIVSTQCVVCLKEFWSRERVLNHIRYRSNVCRENLMNSYAPLTHEQADELDEIELQENIREYSRKGFRRHAARIPVVQAQGPLRQIVLDPSRVSVHHPLGWGHNYHR